MTDLLTDGVGVILRPAQRVAVAVREGNVAVIRTAVIEEVHDSSGKVTLKWENHVRGPKVSTIMVQGKYAIRPRLIVIGES